MGAVVTVDLPEDSPVFALPWIITIGPVGEDEEWEPVVCGPYERAHAMALAENVVADQELVAVVEPVNPFATVDEIRAEVERSIAAGEEEEDEYDDLDDDDLEDEDFDDEGDVDVSLEDEDDVPEVEPSDPPSPAEVRAGFGRIASRLAAG